MLGDQCGELERFPEVDAADLADGRLGLFRVEHQLGDGICEHRRELRGRWDLTSVDTPALDHPRGGRPRQALAGGEVSIA